MRGGRAHILLHYVYDLSARRRGCLYLHAAAFRSRAVHSLRHSAAACPFDAMRTLHMLGPLVGGSVVGTRVITRWWLRPYLKRQAPKPDMVGPLVGSDIRSPSLLRPGIAARVECIGLSSDHTRWQGQESEHFTNRFSNPADTLAVTALNGRPRALPTTTQIGTPLFRGARAAHHRTTASSSPLCSRNAIYTGSWCSYVELPHAPTKIPSKRYRRCGERDKRTMAQILGFAVK